MNQEPGTHEEIRAFVDTYGVEFPMFAKIDVNGPHTHEVFKFLRYNSELFDPKKKEVREIPWNFAKFLVNEKGQVVSYHNPKVEPKSMVEEIEKMLGTK